MRILKAVELKLKGKSYRAIADDLKVSVSVAYDDVWHHFSEVDKLATEKLEQIRKLEVARLDRMLERLTGIIEREGFKLTPEVVRAIGAEQGKERDELIESMWTNSVDIDETAIKAIGTATKLMERRAKLLGLDAPTKTQAVEPEKADVKKLVASVLSDDDVRQEVLEQLKGAVH